jgi:hypothetical protein
MREEKARSPNPARNYRPISLDPTAAIAVLTTHPDYDPRASAVRRFFKAAGNSVNAYDFAET